MQILAINHSLQPQKIWLKFDDNRILPLKIDDLVVLGIKKYTDIDNEFFKKIQLFSANFVMTEYALRQIAISPKTLKLLRQKLQIYSHRLIQKYQFSSQLLSSAIEKVIEYINSKGLIDDTKFIEYYLRRHPKMSQMQIKYNLQNLGIVYINHSSDKDKIIQILSKKVGNKDLTDFNTKNKLISALYRKGFAIGDVRTAIDEYLSIR